MQEISLEEKMTTKRMLTIKDWSNEDKPREKMLEKGRKELSNAELLAILLGSGTQEVNAVELGKEILSSANNDLLRLSRMEISEIMKFKGIGPAKAVGIVAALELGRRLREEGNDRAEELVRSSADVFKYISPLIIDLPTESFWALYLNIRGKILSKKKISEGGLTDVPVDIRLIFKYALEQNATSIVLAHNHPSGHVMPSKADDQLTKRIQEAGQVMGLKILDHIIVGIGTNGRDHYYSYQDEGKM